MDKLVNLKCPDCGGSLELPGDLKYAHCMYCGSKILLPKNEGENTEETIKKLSELLKAAMASGNYQEARDYANKILEVDSTVADVWMIRHFLHLC